MPEPARPPASVIWGAGAFRLRIAPVAFADAAASLPSAWEQAAGAEMDAYYREVSGGRLSWRAELGDTIHLRRPSRAYRLRRRTLRDRVRFWRDLLDAAGPCNEDAILAVVPQAARVRGCFAVGPRWNSPQIDAALRELGRPLIRGAVVRAVTPPGTVAHELGHVLGLPDLYDYRLGRRSASVDASHFVGAWDLMGRPPDDARVQRSHPMAWTKHLTGWITTVGWTPDQRVYRVESGLTPTAVRVPLTRSRALFVEFRSREGYDAAAPAEGVLVSVADERRVQGRGPLRVIGPSRELDPTRERQFGPHWNASLQPGEEVRHRGVAISVLDRVSHAAFVSITHN